MTTNPNTMNVDELRDWCARDDGWEYSNGREGPFWINEAARVVLSHPFPATRDGAAEAMPEGWWWLKTDLSYQTTWWVAGPPNLGLYTVKTIDTGDEIADRYRLAVLARMADKERTK